MANDSSAVGDWTLYQQWPGTDWYQFSATFNPDNTVVVPDGFNGTWQQAGDQVTFTLAPNSGPGSASYQGFLVGNAMGGPVTGTSVSGIWSGCRKPENVATDDLDLMGVRQG